jgi:hypothetical protein
MIPKPKFEIGSKAFAADADYSFEYEVCPACLGSKVCHVTEVSGTVYDAPCPDCVEGYFSSGRKKVYRHAPLVHSLTIGSVRLDTNDKQPIFYMAEETGVGSGRVWYEDALFEDYEAALIVAKTMALERQAAANDKEAEQAKIRRVRELRKPSYEQRRIKDLERQLKELSVKKAAAE